MILLFSSSLLFISKIQKTSSKYKTVEPFFSKDMKKPFEKTNEKNCRHKGFRKVKKKTKKKQKRMNLGFSKIRIINFIVLKNYNLTIQKIMI